MNFIKKLFIRDYKNTAENSVRASYGFVAGSFGLTTNCLLFLGKIFVGILAGSITIIADAINNFFDFISSIVVMFAFKISSKPADKGHPFGHERMEQIIALVVAVIVFAVALFFAERSVEKILFPQSVEVSLLTFAILVSALLVKIFQMLLYKNFANAINSDALRASAVDSRNDVITTSVVIFAMIVIKLFGDVVISLDGIFGLIVSVLIIFSSAKLIAKMVSPLLGEMPQKSVVEKLKQKISAFDGVLGVFNFVIHSYGVKKFFASVDVEVDAKSNLLEISQKMDKIEDMLMENYNIDLSIHIDPVEVDDEEESFLKKKICVILGNINENFVIHDFKSNNESDHTNVHFDLIVPFENKVDITKVESELNEKCCDSNCIFDIKVEHA